ncbi:WD40 repeat domain-containing protein [Allorhodopirellula heiligendammensis]|uniref:WD domain, G-beta repeat n=1 Tax=Allorhodopirellula heiligendammensis TaxID=2714739 RepID=A0A5C6C183_9BACT|nr:PQQ-binding-like beta-propeller repeat protein [Allorhodopirellula heiligendammensis]TWU17928.1 WD domain, G-beta repeat [Allorhodopirellula heiligendammensis]
MLTRRQALTLAGALMSLLWWGGLVAHGESPSAAKEGWENPPERVVSRIFRLPPVDRHMERVVVTAIAVDPKGEFLAVAGDDHVIRILNAQSLAVVHVLGEGGATKSSKPGHFDWIRTLAFDASGDRLASSGNDGQLILWDRRRDFAAMQEIDSAPALACVRFSASGKQIAAVGFDSRVFLIGSTANSAPTLRCRCVDLRCCTYRDDGSVLAVAGRDGYLHLFDPRTGEVVMAKKLHAARIRDIAFMPNSKVLVSVSEDGEMIRFDTGDEVLLSRQKITTGRLFSLAVIDGRTIAAAGSDDEIHIVRVGDDQRELRVQAKLGGHVGTISTLVVNHGDLISGGFDATLRRWDLSKTEVSDNKIALGNDAGVDPLGQTPR